MCSPIVNPKGYVKKTTLDFEKEIKPRRSFRNHDRSNMTINEFPSGKKGNEVAIEFIKA